MIMKKVVESVKNEVKHWWVSLLIGILAIALAVYCMFMPLATILTLQILFVIGFLAMGVAQIIFSVANRKRLHGWGWYLTGGVIDILFAAALWVLPVVSLIIFVGIWVLVQSVWGIALSIELQSVGSRSWGWLLALGIIGILLSFVIIANPIAGGAFVVVAFCAALITYGVFRIYYAFSLKMFGNDMNDLKKRIDRFREETKK